MQQEPTRAVVVAGGGITRSIRVRPGDRVIAADSGYDNARDQDVDVHLLIGDFDSISDEGYQHAKAAGVAIERFSAEKDSTDFELAVEAAASAGSTVIDIYGGEEGSFGHLLGIATALTSRSWRTHEIRWFVDSGTVHPVQSDRPLDLSPLVGTRLTLVPIGDATGVTTTGVRWPLTNEPLSRGTSRGLSNRTTEPQCRVSMMSGALLVVVEDRDSQ